MSANREPTSPTQKSCPGLPGKGCGKVLASWDDHPLCTSCRRTALEPCLGIFACPTCVDWSEEQRLRFNNRCTYHEKVPSSPPSDLGDLLVVNCATDPVPTEPVTSPPPLPSRRIPPRPCRLSTPWNPCSWTSPPSSLPLRLPSVERKGGAWVHALLHRCRTGHPWPPATARHCQTTNTYHLSPAVSRTSGTGAALRLRPTHYSRTSQGTAPSAAHRSPIAAPGAAHVPLHDTHGPSRAAPTTATWIRSDPATATVGHAHPARDGAATPPHGSQITAMRQPRGVSNITRTAVALLAVTFPIDPAGAAAAIDTITTVAVATTRATPSHAAPAAAMQKPVSTAPPTSPHGAAHRAMPGHTAPAPAVLHDVLCVHAHFRAAPPHAPRTDVASPRHVIVLPAALGAAHVSDPAAPQRIMMTILPIPRR